MDLMFNVQAGLVSIIAGGKLEETRSLRTVTDNCD